MYRAQNSTRSFGNKHYKHLNLPDSLQYQSEKLVALQDEKQALIGCVEVALKSAEGKAAATIQDGRQLDARDVAEMLQEQAAAAGEEPQVGSLWPQTTLFTQAL